MGVRKPATEQLVAFHFLILNSAIAPTDALQFSFAKFVGPV
jgi:hypothetical protein